MQLRAKESSDRQILKAGQTIKHLAHRAKRLFILNDRADLARIIGADGVHLGQEDLPIKDARKILGKNKIVGLSAHNLNQARKAQQQGADYIGIGPIFSTTAKPKTVPLSPKIITKIKQKINIPFVAIGGINLDNLEQVMLAGAQRIAVSRAILTAEDVFTATKAFRQRLYPQF